MQIKINQNLEISKELIIILIARLKNRKLYKNKHKTKLVIVVAAIIMSVNFKFSSNNKLKKRNIIIIILPKNIKTKIYHLIKIHP